MLLLDTHYHSNKDIPLTLLFEVVLRSLEATTILHVTCDHRNLATNVAIVTMIPMFIVASHTIVCRFLKVSPYQDQDFEHMPLML